MLLEGALAGHRLCDVIRDKIMTSWSGVRVMASGGSKDREVGLGHEPSGHTESRD